MRAPYRVLAEHRADRGDHPDRKRWRCGRAMVGFPSQAGWIASTPMALLFSMTTRKISWVRRVPAQAIGVVDASSETAEQGESPATATFLVPCLAILAASFVLRANSAFFE